MFNRTFLRFSLIALIALSAFAVGGQSSVQPIPRNLDITPVWAHLDAQPSDISAACMPLDDARGVALYNAYARMPLASVIKVVIYVEFVRQVELRRLSLDEPVAIAELNRYDLPRSNRGAHSRFLAAYSPLVTTIPLGEIAALGMVQYSSNAASDYILARLGAVDWAGLYTLLGMRATDPPHSFAATSLAISNHEDGAAAIDTAADRTLALGESLFARWLTDPDWRNREIAYRDDRRVFPSWSAQMAVAESAMALGTAEDFMRLMRSIYSGNNSPLSPYVRGMTRTALQWRGSARLNATYLEYGSKLGFYAGGILTLVAFGHPIGGRPVVSVIFLRGLSNDAYNRMLDADLIGDVAHTLHLNGCGYLTLATLR